MAAVILQVHVCIYIHATDTEFFKLCRGQQHDSTFVQVLVQVLVQVHYEYRYRNFG